MRHLIGRPLGALSAWAAGLGLGGAAGGALGVPLAGLVVGGGVGVLLLAAVDALRAQRILRWLRTGPEAAAPRDKGFWAEFGYWAERALRRSEQQLARERGELAIDSSPGKGSTFRLLLPAARVRSVARGASQ